MPWNVFGITEARRERIQLLRAGALNEQAPSLETFRDALRRSEPPRSSPRSSETFDSFFPRRGTAKPGVDAVRYWAGFAGAPDRIASGEEPDGLVVWNDGLALREQGRLQAAFWHDKTSFAVTVPAGFDAVEIEYRPTAQERLRHRYLVAEWIAAFDEAREPLPRTLLEVNGVFGTSTFGFHNLQPMRLWKGVYRAVVRTATLPATLFGGSVRTVGAALHTDGDGAFAGRLEHEERAERDVKEAIRRLSDCTSSPEAAAIIIHGLASCAMPAGRQLHRRGFHRRIPTYRYEHDTFGPVNRNAAELVTLIDERLPSTHLLLICHSRGGLVGRRVAATLLRRSQPPLISVFTLGTPHLGTEAADGWWLGSGLYLLGNLYYYEAGATGHDPDPRSVARGYLPSLYPPAGIEALRPESEFLLGLKELEQNTDHVVAYGGKFDPARSGGIATIGASFVAAFGSGLVGEPNDIVVPTASATAVGEQHVLEGSCSHFGYFADEAVLQALEGAALKMHPPPGVRPGVRITQKLIKRSPGGGDKP